MIIEQLVSRLPADFASELRLTTVGKEMKISSCLDVVHALRSADSDSRKQAAHGGIVAVADGSAASGERKDMMCFHCKERGHVRKFCPKRLGKQQVRERERDGGKALCFFCNKPGHLKSDCPARKA